MADQVLDNIIRQLLGPTLVVDSARKVIFASERLRNLVGRDTNFDSCENLIFAPLGERCGGCCWDAIDDYLCCGCHALWPMREASGGWFSAICQLSVVDIAGAHDLIHIRVRPLKAPLERDMALYRSMRAGMVNIETYRRWVTQFFARYGKFEIEWLDTTCDSDPRLHAALDGIGRVGPDAPFDIRVADRNRKTVRRVIAAEGPDGLLIALLRSTGGKLQPGELMAAWAAVCVAAEAPQDLQAPRAGTRILLEGLSPREHEVLALVLDGMTDAMIAERLGLSAHTAKNHVRHIMDKCGVRKRLQLAAIARRP